MIRGVSVTWMRVTGHNQLIKPKRQYDRLEKQKGVLKRCKTKQRVGRYLEKQIKIQEISVKNLDQPMKMFREVKANIKDLNTQLTEIHNI